MLETYEKNSSKKLAATFLSILVIAGLVVFADKLKAQSPNASTTQITSVANNVPSTSATLAPVTDTPTSISTSATPIQDQSTYKDGNYVAISSYYVPHGKESIQVNVSLSNGVVTNASVRNSESNRDSARYQEDFATMYINFVVGKKISGLRLGIIAGASDTTQGFNDALSQISLKAQA